MDKADEIKAKQIEEARAAGAEYQGKESEKPAEPEARKTPSAKADESHAPDSAADVMDAESRKK